MPDEKKQELNEGEMEQASGGGAGYSVSSSKSQFQNMGTRGERSGELVKPGESDAGDGDRDGLGGSVRS